MYTYKIIKEAENAKESVIEMGGITNTYTLKQLDDHEAMTKKRMEEATLQLKVDGETIDTMEKAFVFLTNLEEDKYKVVMEYIAKKTEVDSLNLLVEECGKVLKEYGERRIEIKDALGIE